MWKRFLFFYFWPNLVSFHDDIIVVDILISPWRKTPLKDWNVADIRGQQTVTKVFTLSAEGMHTFNFPVDLGQTKYYITDLPGMPSNIISNTLSFRCC